MALTPYRMGTSVMWSFEIDDPQIDLNMTADRRRLPPSIATRSVGLDNSRVGRFRSANPRRPLGVQSPEQEAITSASSSKFEGIYTNIFQGQYNQTDFDDTGTTKTSLALSAEGLMKGLGIPAELEDGLMAWYGAAGIPVYYGRIKDTNPPKSLTYQNEVAVDPKTGATPTDGFDFTTFWQVQYDKRGIWISDGQRIFLVRSAQITKYLDTADPGAVGSTFFGTRISTGVSMFVHPKRAPRVIRLNQDPHQDQAQISVGGECAITAYDAQHTDIIDHMPDFGFAGNTSPLFTISNSSAGAIIVMDSGFGQIPTNLGVVLGTVNGQTTGTGNMVILPYTGASGTVSTTNKVTMAKIGSNYAGQLSAALIGDLVDLGGGRWGIRIVPDTGATLTEQVLYANTDIVSLAPVDDKSTYGGLLAVDNGLDKNVYQVTMAASAGGSLSAGDYRVRTRQIDEETGTVSAIVDAASSSSMADETFTVTAAVNNKITVSINATGSPPYVPNDPRATHYELYRTAAGGSVFYLDRTVPVVRDGDDVTADIELTQSDFSLGFQNPLTSDALAHGGLPPIGKRIASANGITLIAGKVESDWVDPEFNAKDSTATVVRWPVVEDDETVYFSALDAFLPESFNPEDRRRLSSTGDAFQNFAVSGSVVVAVMTEGAHRIDLSASIPVITRIAEKGIGTPWPNSVIAVGGRAFWATSHGVYVYYSKYDRDTGKLEYLYGKGGDNLQSWLEEAFKNGDEVFCGYDNRDDILRVRRVAQSETPFQAAQANDIMDVTSGSQAGEARLLKSATPTSLGWFIPLDAPLVDGDEFTIYGRNNVIADSYFGWTLDEMFVQTPTGTPYSAASPQDVIVFTDGPNAGKSRVLDTASDRKMSWAIPLEQPMENSNELKVYNSLTQKFAGDSAAINGVFRNAGSSMDTVNDGSLTNITTAAIDRNLEIAATTISQDDTLTIRFDEGYNNLDSSSRVFIYVSDLPEGANTMVMRPYVTSSTIDTFVSVIASVVGTGWVSFIVSQEFRDALAVQGTNGWYCKIGFFSQVGSTTLDVSEIDAVTPYFQKTTTTISDQGRGDFSTVAVGDVIAWTKSYNLQGESRVITSAPGSGSLSWDEPLSEVPRDLDDFVIVDAATPEFSETVWPWVMDESSVAQGGGAAPFTGVSVGDFLVCIDGNNKQHVRKVATAQAYQLTWDKLLDFVPLSTEKFDISDQSVIRLQETTRAEDWRVDTTSIIAPDGVSLAAQYAFKTQTWTLFTNDVGTHYARSTNAEEVYSPVPALYSIGGEGAVFELNTTRGSHPYDPFTVQDVMSSGYTVTNTSIQIDTPGAGRRWTELMVGDSIRFKSTNPDIDGQVRRITTVATGATHVITFTPGVNGLATDDTYIIGANHFKIRMAPMVGSDFSHVKTLHGLGFYSRVGERNKVNATWPDPPTAKLDVRSYRDVTDEPIAEALGDISIESSSGDTLSDEDHHSSIECQGNAIEVEIEMVDARHDIEINHYKIDVVEDGVDVSSVVGSNGSE